MHLARSSKLVDRIQLLVSKIAYIWGCLVAWFCQGQVLPVQVQPHGLGPIHTPTTPQPGRADTGELVFAPEPSQVAPMQA
jgi:hypothetical protein